MNARIPLLASLAASFALTGCVNNPMRSYDAELTETVTQVRQGQLQQAVDVLEKNNKPALSVGSKDGKSNADNYDLLYFMEKGELLKLKQDFPGSRDAWLSADEKVRVWEDEVRTNPDKLLGDVGSFLVNDRVRRYDGQDYEKVFLSTTLALDHILLGNFADARIEMKKTYERETLIKQFREKEYDKIEEDASKNGIKTDTSVLGKNGYPLAELETPEVRQLKNGYQNAFAHYLAGYYFEMTGEYSLSEPGYRNALMLKPDSKMIKDKLERVGRNPAGANQTDVLFVIEAGFAPAWKSVTIPLPIPINKQWVATPLSFPVLKAVEPRVTMPASIRAAGKDLPVETLVNVDAMAHRMLKDQLPGILGRTMVRAVLKSAVQYQAQKQAGPVGGIVAAVATVATEQADERSWRTLPERLAIARTILPQGENTLEFQTPQGTYRTTVNIGPRMAVIPIRLTGGTVYVQQPDPAIFAGLPMISEPEPAVPARKSKAPVRKSKKATPQ